MAIRVFPDRIEFNNYSLRIDDDGVRVTSPTSPDVDGTFTAQGISFFSPMYGTVSGYTSGGDTGNDAPVVTVDKFPFATDANATDVGDLTLARRYNAAASSQENGYNSGGTPLPSPATNTIDKFPFASGGNATDVGDMLAAKQQMAGQSSLTSGYNSGGYGPMGNSSTASGYAVGNNPRGDTIDKFPFAADGNATDVGDLNQGRNRSGSQSSTESGYVSGGDAPGSATPVLNSIDKYPFATDANATDVGDLTTPWALSTGQSSSTFGYNSGGIVPLAGPSVNRIDKFPFTTDANATDVGDLSQSRYGPAGQQD